MKNENSAAASPASRLRSAGSLAITTLDCLGWQSKVSTQILNSTPLFNKKAFEYNDTFLVYYAAVQITPNL